jgi:hypothetical protein
MVMSHHIKTENYHSNNVLKWKIKRTPHQDEKSKNISRDKEIT